MIGAAFCNIYYNTHSEQLTLTKTNAQYQRQKFYTQYLIVSNQQPHLLSRTEFVFIYTK